MLLYDQFTSKSECDTHQRRHAAVKYKKTAGRKKRGGGRSVTPAHFFLINLTWKSMSFIHSRISLFKIFIVASNSVRVGEKDEL